MFQTIPLEKVTSVETLSRMGYRVLHLHTSHDELSFKTFESKELFDQVYESLEASRDDLAPSLQTAPSAVFIPQQIKEFAELRDAGILTEEEFMTKKAHLLEKL